MPEDWTDISSPLENIKVSKDWKFIKDYSQYLQRSQKLYKRRMLDNMDVYKCAEVVVEWYNYIRSKPYGSARCGNCLAPYTRPLSFGFSNKVSGTGGRMFNA